MSKPRRTYNLKATAAAISRGSAWLSRQLIADPKVPHDRNAAGKPLFNLDEAREYFRDHPRRTRSPQSSAPVEPAPPVEPELPESEETLRLRAILTDPAALPLEKTRAAFNLAGLALAAGRFSPRELEAFGKQALELRRAEEGYLELERARGQLIDLGVARAVLGELAGRLNRCHDALANALQLQVDQWLNDPAFVALPTEERHRLVRAWADLQGREVRASDAAEVARMIEAKGAQNA